MARRAATGSFSAGWRWLRRLLLLSPTVLAAVYYAAIASDQFESEAHFIVRSASRPESAIGFSAFIQSGLGRSQDEAFATQDFMTSRDAIRQLRSMVPLAEAFAVPGADFLARYPSFLYGATEEEFYKYFQRMISVTHNSATGITAVRIRAFRAEDAQAIANGLLVLSERLINRINARIKKDAISDSENELALSQKRLVEAQIALSTFRSRELMIDPARNAVTLGELIGKLSSELAQTHTQTRELLTTAPNSPQLSELRRHATAVDQQILLERTRITGTSDGLAERIASYDRLNLAREFAGRLLTTAEADLARAHSDYARQQLYLERIVEPALPDYAAFPRRIGIVLTVFSANLLLVLVGWLLLSGVREHAGE